MLPFKFIAEFASHELLLGSRFQVPLAIFPAEPAASETSSLNAMVLYGKSSVQSMTIFRDILAPYAKFTRAPRIHP